MRLPLAAAVLLTLPAAACAPKAPSDATPTPVEVTVATEALSPYAIEVRWTTATETESPVAFDDGTGEETLLADAGNPVTDHIVLVQLLEAGATYSIRVGDGTGFTGTATEETPNAPGGPFNVLFDAAHGEDAGNADWVIDNDFPTPAPASPSSES